jgi:hypothetical protein
MASVSAAGTATVSGNGTGRLLIAAPASNAISTASAMA